MYKFVRTKSHTGSKVSKIFFEQLYTGWIVVVHLCFGFFSVASDGATTERQIQNRVFWSISYQFEEGYHRQLCIDLDIVYDICYMTRCALKRTKHFADPFVGGATRFAKLWSRFCRA